ncbi:MAG: hypothetical protein R3181_09990 [Rubricoccaceae bacterium]|nr:hypothetical protein [Rubricoccaceae bacterium]
MSDAPAPTPSTAALLLAALGVGLIVVMLLAVVLPRSGAEEGANWVVALLGGLVAAAATYAVGAMRKGGRTTDAHPPR